MAEAAEEEIQASPRSDRADRAEAIATIVALLWVSAAAIVFAIYGGNISLVGVLAIGPFIADFACLAHKLIVEADGPIHDPVRDLARDMWLQSQGFLVLRFTNGTIIDRPHVFIAAVLEAVRKD